MAQRCSYLKRAGIEGEKFVEMTDSDSDGIYECSIPDGFSNVIFVSCNFKNAKYLNLKDENIKVDEEMPELNISEALKTSIEKAMTNKFIKNSRVIDTKDGGINPIKIMILQEKFDEETLIKGFEKMTNEIDRDFHTLSYLFRFFN